MFEARGLGKAYAMPQARTDRGLSAGDDFWAVRDVSFRLGAGDTLGIVGRNGAGKSTLLGILAGTVQPSAGDVRVGGRLASLLELGTGFHPHETGRENAATLLALQARLSRREVAERMPEVVAFSGLGDRIDDPIRTYSDGMRLRLAFAAISVLDPEVLIADEVLLVGDEEFQRQCEAFFDGFLARGGTLVLCSHDLAQIARLCERTLWLEAGAVRALDETRSVLRGYRAAIGGQAEGGAEGGGTDGATHRPGELLGLPFEVTGLQLCDDAGVAADSFASGSGLHAEIEVSAPAGCPHLFVGITTASLQPVYGVASDMDEARPVDLGGGRYRFSIDFPELPLVDGSYRFRAHALDETGTRLYDTVERSFRVHGGVAGRGLVHLRAEFLPEDSA